LTKFKRKSDRKQRKCVAERSLSVNSMEPYNAQLVRDGLEAVEV
jgi:hypothetical protein